MQTKIFDYGMNGEGVAKVDEIITLIPNALINEKVEISITKDYGNYKTAKTTYILSKSPARQVPPCPYFENCGGCNLQHMNYDEQLNFKTLLVKKTLKKIANIDFDVSNTISCPNIFNYRNKVSFNFCNSKSGFFKENSKDIEQIDYCMLTSNNINKIYSMFKNFLIETKNFNNVKNLVIREIENQILVGVVVSKDFDLSTFYKQLQTKFSSIGLYKFINTRNDSVVLSGKVIHVAGLKKIEINNYNLTYSIDLESFHQTNIEIQNKLYNKVLDYVNNNSNVVNGFSGQGLLSAILSKKAKQVVGIEINKSSHLSAEKLKQENHITNLKNVLGDFNKHIKSYIKGFDTIILDPSKKGCGRDVMHNIIGMENIIYISCNPIALAKDLNILKNYYIIEEIIPFDMFPNTKNVETLVKLKIISKN